MGHPSSEVPVMNLADGLDGWLHGFWWNDDNGCRVGFAWHIVRYEGSLEFGAVGMQIAFGRVRRKTAPTALGDPAKKED